MAQQPLVGQDHCMIPLRDTISTKVLWMSDQPDAQTYLKTQHPQEMAVHAPSMI